MPKRKCEGEEEEKKDDDVMVGVKRRQLATQQRNMSAVFIDPVLMGLFDHAARQIQLLSYWGSIFVNFHLLRLLWDVDLDGFPEKIDQTYIRRCFLVVAAGGQNLENRQGFGPEEQAILDSAKVWLEKSGQPPDLMAKLSGMSGMVTSAAKQYFDAFENHQIYGLTQHWVYVVKITYDTTQKISEMVVRKLCEFFRREQFKGKEKKAECVGVTDNVKDVSDEDREKVREEVDRIYELEKELLRLDRVKDSKADDYKRLKTISDNTKFHFAVLWRLTDLAEQREKEGKGTRSFSIAPLCDDAKKAFVEYHKHSLREYFIAVINNNFNGPEKLRSEKVLKVLRRMAKRGGWSKREKHLDISSLFKAEKGYYAKDGWEVSRTFKCDGLVVHRIWERETSEQLRTPAEMVREREAAEFRRRMGNLPALAKDVSSKVYHSTDAAAFNRGENGLFAARMWSEVDLTGEEMHAVDPGVKDVASTAVVYDCEALDLNDTSPGVGQGPHKGKSLSRAEIDDRCRVECERHPVLAEAMSKCSLRTVDVNVFLENVAERSELTEEIIEKYGSDRARSARLIRSRKTRHFYDTIVDELFPNKKCVVAMGDGNVDPSRSPISRLIREIALRRRIVMVIEMYTTKRCSGCRNRRQTDLNAIVDNNNYDSKKKKKKKKKERRWRRSGKQKKPDIHGLRQCPHCHRTWNRDFNAARNIAYAAIHQWRAEGRRPDYLLHPNAPATGDPPAHPSTPAAALLHPNAPATGAATCR